MVRLSLNTTGIKIGKQLIYVFINIYSFLLDIFKKYISHLRITIFMRLGITNLKIIIPFLTLLVLSCSEKKDVEDLMIGCSFPEAEQGPVTTRVEAETGRRAVVDEHRALVGLLVGEQRRTDAGGTENDLRSARVGDHFRISRDDGDTGFFRYRHQCL